MIQLLLSSSFDLVTWVESERFVQKGYHPIAGSLPEVEYLTNATIYKENLKSPDVSSNRRNY